MEQTTTKTLPEARTEAPEAEKPRPADSETAFRRRTSALRNPRVKWGMAIAAIILVIGGILLWRYLSSYESTDDAQVDGHINSISPRVPGMVVKLNVQDNQYVEAGAVLIEIDPTDYQVALDRARANYQDAVATANGARVNVPITSVSTTSQVATAGASVENARAGVQAAKQQYQAAKAQLQQAEANNARAQSDLVRYKQLVDKQEISQQQYDQAVAVARVSAAGVEGARAAADAAQQQISQDDIWVTANVKETQLKGVKVGQSATIAVDATGKKYKGHVDSVAGASGARFSLLPPENATGNFVKVVQRIPVKIIFDSGEDKEHILRPGMSAEPKVWIR